jgi:hydroxymethylbilane synthase
MLPAPAQGAVGIETRADDAAATMLVASIDHAETHACVMAERSLLAALAADCHSPVAALASLAGEMLTLRAELLAEDGSSRVGGWVEGVLGDDLGPRLAVDLLERAAPEVRRLFAGG